MSCQDQSCRGLATVANRFALDAPCVHLATGAGDDRDRIQKATVGCREPLDQAALPRGPIAPGVVEACASENGAIRAHVFGGMIAEGMPGLRAGAEVDNPRLMQ